MAEEQVGPPIAAGRDADVFALDDHRVLRRCRNASDPAMTDVEIEAIGRAAELIRPAV